MTAYTVERQDAKKDHWVTVSNYVTTPTCNVTKLKEGRQYEFRVMAENMNGLSEPLYTTETVLAKNPYGTCIISIMGFCL